MKAEVNNGEKKCYAPKDCYWRISDTNICTSPDKCDYNKKPKKNMKNKPTPEEILEKVTGKKDGYFHESVVQAMQEYAELYHKEKLRGELKAFNNFILKLEAEGKIPLIDSCINEYLKTKG